MRSIENDRSNYQLTQKNKSADGLVFNVVTQDMINKSTKTLQRTPVYKRKCPNTRKLVCKEHREPISRYQGPRESNEEYQFISHSNQKTGAKSSQEELTKYISPTSETSSHNNS
ncbi:CEI_1a_G0005730.mRNA.1.CDS.1 [Saccharomyces cerevisiae]|nr:CEI_1a_G0005730.mRNA.1.CDS.1 [Saccharomyces cerevisiae]CAI7168042.1 CEI_1a_G0005730.mRNA.1.CDS.1 [Saccharomyces cerevisiae]